MKYSMLSVSLVAILVNLSATSAVHLELSCDGRSTVVFDLIHSPCVNDGRMDGCEAYATAREAACRAYSSFDCTGQFTTIWAGGDRTAIGNNKKSYTCDE
ncbi:hypothetical protein BGZ79_010557 [Entomortierella chlamydospora]|nr:hypothetical protein BGZ79_010557 [Entomortierella chlamydospora]